MSPKDIQNSDDIAQLIINARNINNQNNVNNIDQNNDEGYVYDSKANKETLSESNNNLKMSSGVIKNSLSSKASNLSQQTSYKTNKTFQIRRRQLQEHKAAVMATAEPMMKEINQHDNQYNINNIIQMQRKVGTRIADLAHNREVNKNYEQPIQRKVLQRSFNSQQLLNQIEDDGCQTQNTAINQIQQKPIINKVEEVQEESSNLSIQPMKQEIQQEIQQEQQIKCRYCGKDITQLQQYQYDNNQCCLQCYTELTTPKQTEQPKKVINKDESYQNILNYIYSTIEHNHSCDCNKGYQCTCGCSYPLHDHGTHKCLESDRSINIYQRQLQYGVMQQQYQTVQAEVKYIKSEYLN